MTPRKGLHRLLDALGRVADQAFTLDVVGHLASPRYGRVVVAMRASNEASRRACEHHGFTPVRTATRTWPDGANEDEIIYELML